MKKNRIIKIIIGIVIIIAVILAIVGIALSNTPEKRVLRRLSEGNNFLEDMEYEKAIAVYEAVIQIDPENAEAYAGLARAYVGLGDEKEAIQAYEEAVALEVTDADVYKELADIYVKKEQYREALLVLERGIKVTDSRKLKTSREDLLLDKKTGLGGLHLPKEKRLSRTVDALLLVLDEKKPGKHVVFEDEIQAKDGEEYLITIRYVDSEEEAQETFEKTGQKPEANRKLSEVSLRTDTGDYSTDNWKTVRNVWVELTERHHYGFIPMDRAEGWAEAIEYCEELKGHMAIIKDDEENQKIHEAMMKKGLQGAYFGLSDTGKEGRWTWVNGEPADYLNWAIGEPNSETAGENYAMFYWKYKDGTWNDGTFGRDETMAFICEWE